MHTLPMSFRGQFLVLLPCDVLWPIRALGLRYQNARSGRNQQRSGRGKSPPLSESGTALVLDQTQAAVPPHRVSKR